MQCQRLLNGTAGQTRIGIKNLFGCFTSSQLFQEKFNSN